MDGCVGLIPEWFNIVVGVGSEDLPLHISSVTLLQNTALRVLVKKWFKMLADIGDDRQLQFFYEQFGKCSYAGTTSSEPSC